MALDILGKREPDFDEFLKVLWRRGRPDHLPFYEHITTPTFMATRLGMEVKTLQAAPNFWELYVGFWLGMGYDCVPIEQGLRCQLARPGGVDGARSHGSESTVVIRTMDDFETYDWPDESEPIDFRAFEEIAKHLPSGAKMVAGVGGGPYEWAAKMLGVEGLAIALYTDPELVSAVFAKIGSLHVSGLRQLATIEGVGALRQGDDLGFKTSTFLSPDSLREHVFPIYTRMTEVAHSHNMPFILHSCGNLAEVYDDLIDVCHIDAKHSFEDVIMSVGEFKRQYGDRVTPIGGLDVDVICRAQEEELRAYTRKNIEACFADGYWALGTGNSLTDYMPVQNYITVLEEAAAIA